VIASRRGFALPLALWFVVGMATVTALALDTARLGHAAARNRMLLQRAAWARDACIDLLLLHYDASMPLAGVDSTDLGRATWCSVEVSDPATRVNLNIASEALLRRLLPSDSISDAVLDWRDADHVTRPVGAEADWYTAAGRPPPRNGPLQDVAELQLVRGMETADGDSLEAVLTVDGDGRLNAAGAPVAQLAAVLGVDPPDLASLEAARLAGWRPSSVVDLIGRLRKEQQELLAPLIPEMEAALVFEPVQLIVEARGRIGGSALEARARLVAVPLPDRLAVVRRIIW
jgi:type II secretory pathway component PulK